MRSFVQPRARLTPRRFENAWWLASCMMFMPMEAMAMPRTMVRGIALRQLVDQNVRRAHDDAHVPKMSAAFAYIAGTSRRGSPVRSKYASTRAFQAPCSPPAVCRGKRGSAATGAGRVEGEGLGMAPTLADSGPRRGHGLIRRRSHCAKGAPRGSRGPRERAGMGLPRRRLKVDAV